MLALRFEESRLQNCQKINFSRRLFGGLQMAFWWLQVAFWGVGDGFFSRLLPLAVLTTDNRHRQLYLTLYLRAQFVILAEVCHVCGLLLQWREQTVRKIFAKD